MRRWWPAGGSRHPRMLASGAARLAVGTGVSVRPRRGTRYTPGMSAGVAQAELVVRTVPGGKEERRHFAEQRDWYGRKGHLASTQMKYRWLPSWDYAERWASHRRMSIILAACRHTC